MLFDIVEELNVRASEYSPIVKGDSIWIKCPFHSNGNERTQSLRINIVKGKFPIGFFYCYGCGNHGSWNTLADKLSLSRFTEEEQKSQELIITGLTSEQIQNFYGNDCRIDLSLAVPWDRSSNWRGINGELLVNLGAKLNPNLHTKDTNLFLPCYQNKHLRGGISALLERKPGQIAYINTKGPWVKKSLFPFDYVKSIYKQSNKIIALVEGPRDALNLIQHGLPALAILGSQNWSNFKKELISMLNPKKIILMFDGDDAGNHAFSAVSESLSDFDNLIRFSFPQGKDPADLNNVEIKNLYNYINSAL